MAAMKSDVERLITALIGAEMLAQRKHAEDTAAGGQRSPVVTVSCGYGAQGEELARLLADRLGIPCYDREILDEVARRALVDVELVRFLDQHARRRPGDWWHSVLKGEPLSPHDYRRHLVKVVLGIACSGGVIVGRGANLILGAGEALRVRVVGSLERCAARIAVRDGIEFVRARERVQQADAQRSAYIRTLYGGDIDDSATYDLVINSDCFTAQGMVDLVVAAMHVAGPPSPAPVSGAGLVGMGGGR
jgi:hypothetical protein